MANVAICCLCYSVSVTPVFTAWSLTGSSVAVAGRGLDHLRRMNGASTESATWSSG